MLKAISTIAILTLLVLRPSPGSDACSVDRLLEEKVNAAPLALTPVMITFDHQPAQSDFDALRSLGIRGGHLIAGLPIIQTAITRGQLDALRALPGVVSLYADRRLRLLNDKSRAFIGRE